MNRRLTESNLTRFAVGVAIIALIWIVFGQTLGHDFVNFDDKTYVYGNGLVSEGLSVHGLKQAFVDTQTDNWHPLTIISHMLDCQIFGLQPGGHHFTNILFHAVAALLLFFFLTSATGRFWSAAFVTALFAIHPLRVESVAWIAERKDVLSAVFFFLTLIAYLRYARSPSVGRYAATAILLACGLMSKPMLVTTPAILLLLDYWPLRRWQGAGSEERRAKSEAPSGKSQNNVARLVSTSDQWSVVRGLVIEKLPLFGLSLAASIIAFALQVHSSKSIGQLPFWWRFENAVVSYVTYIWQIFWPANLAVFYPHPDDRLAFWQVALATVFLIAMTWAAFALRKRYPYLLVGWLWYFIMLLPVIGIIQVGLQGRADRYTYLPHIGLYLALTWLIADLSTPLRARKQILGAAGLAVVIVLTACARKQTTYWRNSETLWTRALAVTKNNDVALTNMANSRMDHGDLTGALNDFQRALEVRFGSESRHYHFSLAIIHDGIGVVLARTGKVDDAISHFRQAIEFRPDFPGVHYNLGTVLIQKGDIDDAIAEWQTMLSLSPYDAGGHTSLGNALVQKGFPRDAADHYEKALQSDPDSILALNNLAWLMSTGPDDSIRNNEIGIQLAMKANRLSRENNPIFVRTLAAAYAQAGQFENAIHTARHAAELATAQGESELAREIMDDADLYQRGQPLRDLNLRNAQ